MEDSEKKIWKDIRLKNPRKKPGCAILTVLLAGSLSCCIAASMPATAKADAVVKVSQPANEASLTAMFDPESKWQWMDNNFELDVTTDDVPREGILFTADLLIQSSSKPRFQGRMNVVANLLLGEEQRWVQSAVPAQIRAINFQQETTQNGAVWYRSKIAITFSGTVNTDVNGIWTEGIPYRQAVNRPVTGIKVYIAGTQCDYNGTIRLENPKLVYTADMDDGISVNTAVSPHDLTEITLQEDVLLFEDGKKQRLPEVKLVDSDAEEITVRTARYLAALGNSDHVIFGHQNSAWSKAGTVMSPLNGLTNSDVADITGSMAGVVGFDGLSLVGEEFGAELWNSKFAWQGMQSIDIAALGESEANVKALAYLSDYCLTRGALITLSCHMPNFSQVRMRSGCQKEKEPAYACYDFTTSTARDKDSGSAQDILPGGKCNIQFQAYLDMVADYASQVKGTILFRPFHEGNGTWFWWGTSACDAKTYKEIFRYTVEYLRDRKQVHNLLYVYSPAAKPGFMTETIKRYPGDAYVDVIGFDNYHQTDLSGSDEWFADFSAELSEIEKFATQHGKLLAVTETGANTSKPASGDVVTGLTRTGCSDLQWFEKLLDRVSGSNACYVLLWSNGSEMFHTPFVRAVNSDGSLYGHELLDDFLRFYNDRRSIFANNQKNYIFCIK